MSATVSVSTPGVPEDLRKEGSDALSSKNLERIRGEYIEMPGLVLTVPQAARLGNHPAPVGATIVRAGERWIPRTRPEEMLSAAMKSDLHENSADRSGRDAATPPVSGAEIAGTNEPPDIVDEASTESFPASDPPSWTLGIERE